MTWLDRAACRGDVPERWHSGGDIGAKLRAAVITCGRCPVTAECATDALAMGDVCTIRVGLDLTVLRYGSDAERADMRTSLRAAAAGGRPVADISTGRLSMRWRV